MKKALLILSFLMCSGNAHAAYAPVTPTVPVEQSLALGLGSVAFAAWVIYANANGIAFPLCGLNDWKCYEQYPTGRNGQ